MALAARRAAARSSRPRRRRHDRHTVFLTWAFGFTRNEASMRLNRIFCDGPLTGGTEVDLPSAGAYHVARVLRMREGAPLSVFDGSGHEFRAEITRVDGDRVAVMLGD